MMLIGIIARLSGPRIILRMWGITNPMNPITPTNDTAAATIIVVNIRMINLVRLTSIPRSIAWMSPSIMALSALACVMRRTIQVVIIGIMNAISSHDAPPRLPIVQNTIPSRFSPAMNVRKDTRAANNDETATPERIRVSVRTVPPIRDIL